MSKLLELGFLAEEQTSNGEMKSVFIQYQFNSNEKKEEFCKSNIQESNVDKSDVDLNIPITNTINTNTIVVIIANQNYQEESDVEFAINDGSIFKEYCISTLGIPE